MNRPLSLQPGDLVRYKTRNVSTIHHGCKPGEVLVGRILECFRSLDGTYGCFWIEGQPELITEYQIIERI